MTYCDKKIEYKANNSYRLLIVEDTKFMNDSIHKTLSGIGYLCDQAFSFEETTHFIEETSYDFILLDLNLPDANGYKLVEDVKKLSRAKIIVLTSETDVELREELYKLGILDYLIKDKFFNESVADIHDTIQGLQLNAGTDILVIDDSKFLQSYIKQVLSLRNYHVTAALTANEGYEILSKTNISLIVLDMELPDIDGIEFLKKIKKTLFCKIPVIVLSSSTQPEMLRNALKSGALEYLYKPFNIEELVLKVEIAIHSYRQERQILCEQQLLSEYKEAVDRSSIVSKTNPQGIITFVNQTFEEISGYSEAELIGKNHNIVRHPDMPASAFKEMWETIQSKKPWYGKVKNRKKDGSAYWVNTVINPIVDYDGNVVEYIGIRTDITELEMIKAELEEHLNITHKNFKEAYKISQEYQRAIDESNILSRTDTNGAITFVNERFCEISGYEKEELIGKTHRVVKHPSNPPQLFKNLWETITSGKVWHGQLKNRAKDGSTYYLDSTIVPIFDDQNRISEYLGIRHDVTEIVMFHQELENTQKEVIHKMGEVGESRSKETGFHVKRVAEYSKLLALLAGLGSKNAELLYAASPMHDIGKVGIPDAILKKPGPLDDDEWKIMRSHCDVGFNILKESKRPILKAAAIVAYRHHEKWDGSGYPKGINGENIHIFGRITAIADVFDALGSDRCYKKAWELERIIDLFKEERGKQFDPHLVDIFLEHIDKFLKIRDRYKDVHSN